MFAALYLVLTLLLTLLLIIPWFRRWHNLTDRGSFIAFYVYNLYVWYNTLTWVFSNYFDVDIYFGLAKAGLFHAFALNIPMSLFIYFSARKLGLSAVTGGVISAFSLLLRVLVGFLAEVTRDIQPFNAYALQSQIGMIVFIFLLFRYVMSETDFFRQTAFWLVAGFLFFFVFDTMLNILFAYSYAPGSPLNWLNIQHNLTIWLSKIITGIGQLGLFIFAFIIRFWTDYFVPKTTFNDYLEGD
jgi:hypothetical protein